MSYSLFLSREFEKQYSKLDGKTQARIISKLTEIEEAPHHTGKPLKHNLKGIWSARAGKHRILYLIDEKKRRINVITVKPRKYAYKNR
ncbi:type II toxin-antitoxin system RelE family toxin [Candidatus Pyrohabitans sp.]